MSQDHHHHTHSHRQIHGAGSGSVQGRLWISIALNLCITIAEFVGGFLSGSLALISDAVHNLSDTMSLGVSLIAMKISVREADKQKTFGYRRAEIIGAFINLIVLVVIALYLISEAVERFYSPVIINGPVMLLIALVGLAGNLISMVLLHNDSKDSLNIKSAYVHLLWDTVSSVAVIAGGIIVWIYELYIIDTLLTVAIALYILYHTWYLLRETINILMESAPVDIDIREIETAIEAVGSVRDAHHVHVWNLTEKHRLLECHVRIDENSSARLEEIKSAIKQMLGERFRISHSTLEFELEPCDGVQNSAPCLLNQQ